MPDDPQLKQEAAARQLPRVDRSAQGRSKDDSEYRDLNTLYVNYIAIKEGLTHYETPFTFIHSIHDLDYVQDAQCGLNVGLAWEVRSG